MGFYRKKPVVIEAFQYQPGKDEAQPYWIHMALAAGVIVEDARELSIATEEGLMTAQPGDWIIKGVKGELYPCKPDIFQMTYESA